jgi:hypothetical protein
MRVVEAKLKEGLDLSVSLLHLLPLGSTPLELDPETLWKDRLLIQVSNIVFIVLTVHNSLSTLIPAALELKLHV